MRSDIFGPIIALIALVGMILLFAGFGYATHVERMACIAAGHTTQDCVVR